MAACEERLLKTKVIGASFTVAEIQGGILKHLIEEDYAAPLMVSLADFPQVTSNSQIASYQGVLYHCTLPGLARLKTFENHDPLSEGPVHQCKMACP